VLHSKVREEEGEEEETTTTKTKEKRKRIKTSHLARVKPLNPNKNPSFIFFTERMITIKTKFLNSGSASSLPSWVILTVVFIFVNT